MSIVVNTNIASMNAQRSMATSGRDLQEAMERLSTGLKINSAADDAAGFAIAESMTAQVRGLSMSAKNASDALGLLKVVENASNDVTDMLQRVRELAVQAASGTNSASDIKNLQGEADALMTEITRVSSDTTYNGKARIGSDAGTINIQVGYNDGDQIALKTYSVSAKDLGLESDALLVLNKASAKSAARADTTNITSATAAGVTAGAAAGVTAGANADAAAKELSLVGFYNTASDGESGDAAAKEAAGNAARALQANIDTATAAGIAANTSGVRDAANTSAIRDAAKEVALVGFENAAEALATKKLDISSATALTTISSAIDKLSGHKAEWGAGQNRLEYTVSNLMNVVEFTSAARSRIEDADFAVEAARLAKNQVLQQTGAAMLAQANASPQLALSLLA